MDSFLQIHIGIAPAAAAKFFVYDPFTRYDKATNSGDKKMKVRRGRGEQRPKFLFRSFEGALDPHSLADVLCENWHASTPLSRYDCFRSVTATMDNPNQIVASTALAEADKLLYHPNGLRLSFPPPCFRTLHNSLLNEHRIVHRIAINRSQYFGKEIKLSTRFNNSGSGRERPLSVQEIECLDFVIVLDYEQAELQNLRGLFCLPKKEVIECLTTSERRARSQPHRQHECSEIKTFGLYPPAVVPRLTWAKTKEKAMRQMDYYIDPSLSGAGEKLKNIYLRNNNTSA
ncbi:unnamed protein product [Amoebophrya sp. A120]|nr:unnamed protein product [Amoebophrya sp. A120]|eukprot:GSA120T00004241001.1